MRKPQLRNRVETAEGCGFMLAAIVAGVSVAYLPWRFELSDATAGIVRVLSFIVPFAIVGGLAALRRRRNPYYLDRVQSEIQRIVASATRSGERSDLADAWQLLEKYKSHGGDPEVAKGIHRDLTRIQTSLAGGPDGSVKSDV